jgi:predicted nuclease with TOPRIM domain
MTEINAYMNEYSPGDIKFLEASLQAHKDALKESKEKIKSLQAENKEHCETKALLGKQVFVLTKRVDELTESQQKVERLEKALQFYAEPSTYKCHKIEDGILQTKIDEDTGDTARQALSERKVIQNEPCFLCNDEGGAYAGEKWMECICRLETEGKTNES